MEQLTLTNIDKVIHDSVHTFKKESNAIVAALRKELVPLGIEISDEFFQQESGIEHDEIRIDTLYKRIGLLGPDKRNALRLDISATANITVRTYTCNEEIACAWHVYSWKTKAPDSCVEITIHTLENNIQSFLKQCGIKEATVSN